MTLRFVNRKWKDASTPFVFDSVQLRLFASSQRKFNELCHSELAKYSKTVDLRCDFLPSLDKDTWLSRVDLRPELHSRGRVLDL
jgi:hypothetical protein